MLPNFRSYMSVLTVVKKVIIAIKPSARLLSVDAASRLVDDR
jgi:hypothetical protein